MVSMVNFAAFLAFQKALTKIKEPAGKQAVTIRLHSEEAPVNNCNKMISLLELRDHVSWTRVNRCHWDMDSFV